MTVNNLLAAISFCLLFLFMNIAQAEKITIESLQSQGDIKMKVRLAESTSPQAETITNQQVTLLVELLSTRPFDNNFSLPYFDLDDAVVIPPNDKATLSLKIIEGKQWFVQQKEIKIYPLKSGNYTIPELTATTTIKYTNEQGPDGGKGGANAQKEVHGSLSSSPIQFDVTTPAQLNNLESFVVSPNVGFTVDAQHKSKSTSEKSSATNLPDYHIGSTVTLTYTISASEMHVIMLKKLNFKEIEGVQIYQKPAIEKDVFDRFEKFNTASLKQEVTFIFQKEGQFTIPGQSLYWWDLTEQKLKEIKLKPQIFLVGASAASGSNDLSSSINNSESGSLVERVIAFKNKFLSQVSNNKSLVLYILLIIAFFFFCIALVRKAFKHKEELLSAFHRFNKTKEKRLIAHFKQHIANKEYKEAVNCLYQLTNEVSGSITPLSNDVEKSHLKKDKSVQAKLEHLNSLKQLAFKAESQASFTEEDAKQLIASILTKNTIWNKLWHKKEAFKFSYVLNPEK
ncbi:MAG: hypothetical protein ACPGTQ_03675 [Colwellia sp.]